MQIPKISKSVPLNIITYIVITILTSGCLVYLSDYFIEDRKYDTEDKKIELENKKLAKLSEESFNKYIITEIRGLKKDVLQLSNENDSLKTEIRDCQYNTMVIQAVRSVIPLMFWMTDKSHRITSLNNVYENENLRGIGYSRSDLLYTTGSHIYGKKITDEWAKNNDIVLRSDTILREIESVIDFNGDTSFVLSIKKRNVINGRVVGTVGIGIKVSDLSEIPNLAGLLVLLKK